MKLKNILILVLLIFVIGCNSSRSKILFVHSSNTEDQMVIDLEICKADGYRVAGSAPSYQAPPECEKGFSCGYAKGTTARANSNATQIWNAAFTSGVKACMYEKGYTQVAK